MSRENLKAQLLEIVGDIPVEGVVIGRLDEWSDKPDPQYIGKVLPFEEALQYLDYEYYRGFGEGDCHPICLYTNDRILVSTRYDGSTGFMWIQRHPISHLPIFIRDTFY